MEPVYVLKENDTSIDTYYHCHGSFAGKKLVVKQIPLKYARCFPTKDAAETFLAGLPDWLQGRFAVKEVKGLEQLWACLSPNRELIYSMSGAPLGLMFCFDERKCRPDNGLISVSV